MQNIVYEENQTPSARQYKHMLLSHCRHDIAQDAESYSAPNIRRASSSLISSPSPMCGYLFALDALLSPMNFFKTHSLLPWQIS
jgi:hypothetical protein